MPLLSYYLIKNKLFHFNLIKIDKSFVYQSINKNRIDTLLKLLDDRDYFIKKEVLQNLTKENIKDKRLLKTVIGIYRNDDLIKIKLEALLCLKRNANKLDIPRIDQRISKLKKELYRKRVANNASGWSYRKSRVKPSIRINKNLKRQSWG